MNLNDPISASAEWLAACVEASQRAAAELDRRTSIEDRLHEIGTRGAGGDMTLEIDALAEDAVFAALEKLVDRGASFTVISEERGVVAYGDGNLRIAVDPIDGSLNAKRGLVHSSMSIAVADGPTTDDIAFAYVWDFGAREAFHAVRGGGAFLNGEPVRPLTEERRMEDGRLELLCIETNDAARVAEISDDLARAAFRWRILGSIACALCQVATPRVDAMVNVSQCRAIDVAAGLLIVRESGGHIYLSGGGPVELGLNQQIRLAAARSRPAVDALASTLRR